MPCLQCNRPTGDHGLRYEVRFQGWEGSTDGSEHVMGWSEDYPHNFVKAIELHYEHHSPRVIDRQSGAACQQGMVQIPNELYERIMALLQHAEYMHLNDNETTASGEPPEADEGWEDVFGCMKVLEFYKPNQESPCPT